jgi:tetratricopeptide (TPR) repeat protein
VSYLVQRDPNAFLHVNDTIRKREFYRGLHSNLLLGSEQSAKFFDLAFPGHNEAFCLKLAGCYKLITPVGITAAQEEIPQNFRYIFQLCAEGLNTLMAAYRSLRNGEATGSVVILRQTLECLSLSLALWKDPEKFLPTFEQGKLSGEKLIGVAKDIIPFVGRLYGIFSGEFAHPSIRLLGKSFFFEDPMFRQRQRVLIGPAFHPEHHEHFAKIVSYTQLIGLAYHAGIELMFWNWLSEQPHFWGTKHEHNRGPLSSIAMNESEQNFMERFVDGPMLPYMVDNLKKWIEEYPIIKEAHEILKKEGVQSLTDLASLIRTSDRNPRVAFMKYLVAEVAERDGNADLAFQSLIEYLSIPGVPALDAYFTLARIFESRGQTEKAVDYYRMHLKVKPDSFKAMSNLGSLYDKLGQFGNAIKCFKHAQAIEPEYYNGALKEGNAWLHKRKWDKAIEAYGRASRYDSSSAEPFHNIGIAFMQKGDDETAYTYFRRAVLKDRNYLPSWANLGAINLKRRRLRRAEQCLSRAFAVDSGNISVIINLSLIHSEKKNWKEALFFSERALRLYPDSPEAKMNLDDIRQRSKDATLGARM